MRKEHFTKPLISEVAEAIDAFPSPHTKIVPRNLRVLGHHASDNFSYLVSQSKIIFGSAVA